MTSVAKERTGEAGTVLILTLLIVALLTSLAMEFAYGVFVGTNTLYNYRDGQKLSLMAKSGITLAIDYLADYLRILQYSTVDKITFPVTEMARNEDAQKGNKGQENIPETMIISITDENAKFNINKIIYPNGTVNDKEFESFKRLLSRLGLNEDLAARITDWLDKDGSPRLTGSEEGAKNSPLYNMDELLLIPKLTEEDYKKLLPFVTTYGNGLVNVNTAGAEVLMALADNMDASLAARIIEFRTGTPFHNTSDIVKVPGLEHIGTTLMGRITVKSSAFSMTATASEGGLSKEIEAVAEVDGGKKTIRYWKEW